MQGFLQQLTYRQLLQMSELWQEICERRTDLGALPVVVVGNKTDLSTKKVPILP